MRFHPAWGLLLCCLALAWGCGKKAPPVAPGRSFSQTVTGLNGTWQGDVLTLEGRVTGREDRTGAGPGVSGFRLYHVRYGPGEAPCAGCPVAYRGYQEEVMDRGVVDGPRFRARVALPARPGTHFFAVGLLGDNGAVGPLSDSVRLQIQEKEKGK